MAASKTARNVVAVLVVGAMLAAAAAMWWLGERRIALLGSPLTLSLSAQDELWVGQAEALHRLDASGRRLARLSLSELGLPAPRSHLHAVAPDDLLVSAGTPTRLYRCTPSQRACRLADQGYVDAFGGFARALWIGADADGSRVVVSDNAAHRLAVLDAQGRLLAHDGGAGSRRFLYPGQPVWQGERSIWLAGADAKAIERFEFTGDALTSPLQTERTPTQHPLLAGRDWPMALAPAGDGRWWAIVQYDMMKPGGLLRFVEGSGFDRDARLPAAADLSAVARLGDGLVVADLHAPSLWRLDLDGGGAQPFGDAALREELAAEGAQRLQLDRWRQALIGALAGIPLVGLLALVAMGEALRGDRRSTR